MDKYYIVLLFYTFLYFIYIFYIFLYMCLKNIIYYNNMNDIDFFYFKSLISPPIYHYVVLKFNLISFRLL